MSTNAPTKEKTPRAPRRLVLLKGADDGEVESVLLEYAPEQVSGTKLHADLRRLSAEHPGRRIAAEWMGPLGWTRFLWCGHASPTPEGSGGPLDVA